MTTTSDREITLLREFDAPRQLVWDCHTKPELVRKWLLGPPGWTMPVCEIDLRVGGKYPSLWHVRHMANPASTTPGSIMPRYPHLLTTAYDTSLNVGFEVEGHAYEKLRETPDYKEGISAFSERRKPNFKGG